MGFTRQGNEATGLYMLLEILMLSRLLSLPEMAGGCHQGHIGPGKPGNYESGNLRPSSLHEVFRPRGVSF